MKKIILSFLLIFICAFAYSQQYTCTPIVFNPGQSGNNNTDCNIEVKAYQNGCDPEGLTINTVISSTLYPVGHGFSSLCYYAPTLIPGTRTYNCPITTSNLNSITLRRISTNETITITGNTAVTFLRILRGELGGPLLIGNFQYDCDGEAYDLQEKVYISYPGQPQINTYIN